MSILSGQPSLSRLDAAEALVKVGKIDRRVVDNLISLLSDESPSVRGRAAHVMGDIGELDRDITERLMSLLLDENEVPSVRWRAAYGLVKAGVVNEIILPKFDSYGNRLC